MYEINFLNAHREPEFVDTISMVNDIVLQHLERYFSQNQREHLLTEYFESYRANVDTWGIEFVVEVKKW